MLPLLFFVHRFGENFRCGGILVLAQAPESVSVLLLKLYSVHAFTPIS
jgi:hypothetical protein